MCQTCKENFVVFQKTHQPYWGDQNVYLSLQQAVVSTTCLGLPNSLNIMEYNIDVPSSYTQAVKDDIQAFIDNWGITDFGKINLGLMPGLDDMKHNLTKNDMLDLVDFVKKKGFNGIMTWDHGLVDGGRSHSYDDAQTIIDALGGSAHYQIGGASSSRKKKLYVFDPTATPSDLPSKKNRKGRINPDNKA